MKKLLSLLLIPAFLLSFAACSGSGDDGSDDEEDTVYSAEEAARQHLMATFEGDVGKQYDFEILDNNIRSQAFSDQAEANGISSDEYYQKLSDDLNYKFNIPEDERLSVANYNEFIAMTNIMTYTAKKEAYEETYGSYEIIVEVSDETEMTESDFNRYLPHIVNGIADFERQFSTDTGITEENITKMVRMNFTVTIDGDEKSDSANGEILLAEVNGKWKVFKSDAQN